MYICKDNYHWYLRIDFLNRHYYNLKKVKSFLSFPQKLKTVLILMQDCYSVLLINLIARDLIKILLFYIDIA